MSCSTTRTPHLNSSLENIYISSGIEQYFLPNLPAWANFSTAGQCFRKSSIRFLDFEKLKKSYDLEYEQMLHLQHLLNRKLYAFKTSSGKRELIPKDEAYIFNNAYQKVIGGSYEFRAPKFKKISVVWIDPFIADKRKIRKIFKRKDVQSGHPILLSHCLNSYELEKLAIELKLDDIGVKYLSAEMLSTYSQSSKEKKLSTSFSLLISELLKEKEIKLYSTKDSSEIHGEYHFIKIK